MENEKASQKKINILGRRLSSSMSLKQMKSLIVLVVGLLAVGCATMKDIGVHLGIDQPNKPERKPKSLRDSVVGEYEWEHEGDTTKQVYLANGIAEDHINGVKYFEGKWSISKGEIHVDHGSGWIDVMRINKDKSITRIANITDGKRKDWSKLQHAYKKIK